MTAETAGEKQSRGGGEARCVPFCFSLKTRFAVIASLLVGFLSATWGLWVWQSERAHQTESLEVGAKMLLSSLKMPIIDSIIYEATDVDRGALRNFITQMTANQDIAVTSACIRDDTGAVVAYQSDGLDDGTFPPPLNQKGYSSRVVSTSRGNFLEVGMPLTGYGKSWGSVTVRLSMKRLEGELREVRRGILFFSALMFVVGTIIFYIIALKMSSPLERLAAEMGKVGRREADPPPFEPRRDEIGVLQQSFCDMVLRLRESERERRKAVDSALQAEKMAAVGRIVSGVAHEVNNPLAAVTASVYTLRKRVTDETSVLCVDILENGLKRIRTIVAQLSDFSRAHELDLRRVPSDRFFEEASSFAAMALKNRDLVFVHSDECPPTTVEIDKGKIHQVLLNLLINAADASPTSGEVSLRAQLVDGSYTLVVSDEGMGIPATEQEKIFDIFYSTKKAGEGSGMGLAISRNIVDMHNGTIGVESRPGSTSFTVSLPAALV